MSSVSCICLLGRIYIFFRTLYAQFILDLRGRQILIENYFFTKIFEISGFLAKSKMSISSFSLLHFFRFFGLFQFFNTTMSHIYSFCSPCKYTGNLGCDFYQYLATPLIWWYHNWSMNYSRNNLLVNQLENLFLLNCYPAPEKYI